MDRLTKIVDLDDDEYLNEVTPSIYREKYIELLAEKIINEMRKERDEK